LCPALGGTLGAHQKSPGRSVDADTSEYDGTVGANWHLSFKLLSALEVITPGKLVLAQDTSALYVFDGTAWVGFAAAP
jgi:hypothetical protein